MDPDFPNAELILWERRHPDQAFAGQDSHAGFARLQGCPDPLVHHFSNETRSPLCRSKSPTTIPQPRRMPCRAVCRTGFSPPMKPTGSLTAKRYKPRSGRHDPIKKSRTPISNKAMGFGQFQSAEGQTTSDFPAAIAGYWWRSSMICATTNAFPTGGLISPGDGGFAGSRFHLDLVTGRMVCDAGLEEFKVRQ